MAVLVPHIIGPRPSGLSVARSGPPTAEPAPSRSIESGRFTESGRFIESGRFVDTGLPIERAAAASAAAQQRSRVQLEPPPTDPACQPDLAVPASARQVVSVRAHGSYAEADLLVRDDTGTWGCAVVGMAARVGRNGTRPLGERVSGDDTTPAGLFPLGTMTAPDGADFQFFGNGTDPGVPGGWHQVQPGDCWDATGGDPSYNTLTTRRAGDCVGDDEYLTATPGAYSRAALIGANMGTDRSGDQPGEVPRAAAIFLHRFSFDPTGASVATSGCVSLAGPELDVVLRTLVPGEAWFDIR